MKQIFLNKIIDAKRNFLLIKMTFVNRKNFAKQNKYRKQVFFFEIKKIKNKITIKSIKINLRKIIDNSIKTIMNRKKIVVKTIATTIVTNVIKKHRAKHCTKFDKNLNTIKSIKINAIRKKNDNFFKTNR